jgi:hypothetical protein
MGRRLNDPKAYCIFYIYFYAAALGEAKMKDDIQQEGRIGNNTTEAFALLMLVNNYKAWLYEEKKLHRENLFTEYDCPPSLGKPSIVDKILDGTQFNLVNQEEPVITDEDDRTYKKLKKERVVWLEAFCKTEPCKQTKENILDKAIADANDDNDEEDEDDFIQKERAKKKRKLARTLRVYTGVASENEPRHKGWSDGGMAAFEAYVKEIKKDIRDEKYLPWETAYREIMDRMDRRKKKSINEPLPETRYKFDLTAAWEEF